MASTLMDLYKLASTDDSNNSNNSALKTVGTVAGGAALGGAGYSGVKLLQAIRNEKTAKKWMEKAQKKANKYFNQTIAQTNNATNLYGQKIQRMKEELNNRGKLRKFFDRITGAEDKKQSEIKQLEQKMQSLIEDAKNRYNKGEHWAFKEKKIKPLLKKVKDAKLKSALGLGIGALTGAGLLYAANKKDK
jgi:molecular chaperone DnaK (HSP70)